MSFEIKLYPLSQFNLSFFPRGRFKICYLKIKTISGKRVFYKCCVFASLTYETFNAVATCLCSNLINCFPVRLL